jgi:hypothetical protein
MTFVKGLMQQKVLIRLLNTLKINLLAAGQKLTKQRAYVKNPCWHYRQGLNNVKLYELFKMSY